MHPILFSIKGINFYSYGLMASLAFFVFSLIFIAIAKREKLYFKTLFDWLIYLFIFALFGARLLYFIVYHNQFENWYEFFYIWNGGMISFGGIIAVIIGALIAFKKNKLKWLDIFAVSFLAGLFFWRMGCFLAGDHPQVLYNGIIALNGEFPAILLESLSGLVGFVFFYWFYNKIKKLAGLTFFMVLIYYGLARFILDNYRLDPEMWGLKTGQITGIGLVIIGLIGIIFLSLNGIKKMKAKRSGNGKKHIR